MEARKKIEMAMVYAGKTKTDLAKDMGMSPQTLNRRLHTGKFTFSELEQIGEYIGAEFRVQFVFQDGTVI